MYRTFQHDLRARKHLLIDFFLRFSTSLQQLDFAFDVAYLPYIVDVFDCQLYFEPSECDLTRLSFLDLLLLIEDLPQFPAKTFDLLRDLFVELAVQHAVVVDQD